MTSSPYVPCYETAANGIRGERTRLRRWPIKPVGCGNPDGAYELRIGTDRSLGTMTLLPLPRHRGQPVLPKRAYFALCRSIQLLAQLGRSYAAKDLEILKENPGWATSASKENSNPRQARLSSRDPRHTPPPPARPCPAAGEHNPARVPALTGRRDRRLRLLHRRHSIGLFARLMELGRCSTSRIGHGRRVRSIARSAGRPALPPSAGRHPHVVRGAKEDQPWPRPRIVWTS